MFSLPSRRAPWVPALCVGVWIASIGNLPWWTAWLQQGGGSGWRGAGVVVALGVFLSAVLVALFSLFAWRWTLRPVLSLFLLATAGGAYFMSTYGVVIDPTMMVNVLHTDAREVRDLMNWRLAWFIGGLALLPMIGVWRGTWTFAPWPRQLGRNLGMLAGASLVAVLAGWLAFADVASAMRNHRSMRYLVNPLNTFYSLAASAADTSAHTGPLQPIGLQARPGPATPRPPLLMLVVGETARADHFALNGYERATNPRLARLPASELLSLREVTSCGTSTAASLPCMFSPLGRTAFLDSDQHQENLLDLLQRAGLAVLWVDNQAGCKGLCDRVRHASASQPPEGVSHPAGLCEGDECFDEALLTGLQARLEALPAAQRAHGVVLVLHQMGSHGPAYSRRSPPGRKPFGPECTTNNLQDCDPQGLVNAYDNSIAYTDEVLGQAQQWLAQQADHYRPALLYVSDHGESLGENHLYLHGLPYAVAPRVQKHVPWVMWLPPQTQSALHVGMDCLQARRDQPFSHDHLFHTVLGLVEVQAPEYQPALDLLQACRAPARGGQGAERRQGDA